MEQTKGHYVINHNLRGPWEDLHVEYKTEAEGRRNLKLLYEGSKVPARLYHVTNCGRKTVTSINMKFLYGD